MTCKVMFLFVFDVFVSEAAFFCIEVCYIEMCSEFCIGYTSIVFCMHFPYDKFVHFSCYVKCSQNYKDM